MLYDNRYHYLPCEQLPPLSEVERIVQAHQDVIQQIEVVNPGFVGVEINTCGEGQNTDITFWYASHKDRIAIEQIRSVTMGYAVGLYFDSQTEQNIREICNVLLENGPSPVLGELGERPHVSLAVFSDVDCDILIPTVQEFAASTAPFDVQLSAIGIFPTNENVLFLAPVPTLQLLIFHHQLAKAQVSPLQYYRPANWMPHCSVAVNIPTQRFTEAIEICRKAFKPLRGQFREIGLVEFRPVKLLATRSLGEQ